jgi:hypothetical protein
LIIGDFTNEISTSIIIYEAVAIIIGTINRVVNIDSRISDKIRMISFGTRIYNSDKNAFFSESGISSIIDVDVL